MTGEFAIRFAFSFHLVWCPIQVLESPVSLPSQGTNPLLATSSCGWCCRCSVPSPVTVGASVYAMKQETDQEIDELKDAGGFREDIV
jgi:hypothetical protein